MVTKEQMEAWLASGGGDDGQTAVIDGEMTEEGAISLLPVEGEICVILHVDGTWEFGG